MLQLSIAVSQETAQRSSQYLAEMWLNEELKAEKPDC